MSGFHLRNAVPASVWAFQPLSPLAVAMTMCLCTGTQFKTKQHQGDIFYLGATSMFFFFYFPLHFLNVTFQCVGSKVPSDMRRWMHHSHTNPQYHRGNQKEEDFTYHIVRTFLLHRRTHCMWVRNIFKEHSFNLKWTQCNFKDRHQMGSLNKGKGILHMYYFDW